MRYNVKKKRKRQKTNFVHVIFHMCNFPNFKIYFVCFNSVKHNVELNWEKALLSIIKSVIPPK